MDWLDAHIVIVVGGLAGASTAYHLARRGARRVVLLEQEPTCGAHASGRNAALKAPAEKEQARPTEAAAQVALGDAWWDYAEKQSGTLKSKTRARAAQWYEQALPTLGGIAKARVEKRLGEMVQGAVPAETQPIDLLKRIDLKKDTVNGDWRMDGAVLVSPTAAGARLLLTYSPPDEYDIKVVAERKENEECLSIGLIMGESQSMVVLDARGTCSGLELVDGRRFDSNETAFRDGRLLRKDTPVVVICSVRKQGVSVSVGGREIFHWIGDPRSLSLHPDWYVPRKSLFVGSWTSAFRIHAITLTPMSGKK